MGTFDELEINGIYWQTKALGKSMRLRRPGDPATVQRVATGDECEDVVAYDYDEVPRRYLVEIYAMEHLLIEDGRIVGLASEDDKSELLGENAFDYRGRDTHDQMTYEIPVFEPRRPRRAMTPVPRKPPRPEHARSRPAEDQPPR